MSGFGTKDQSNNAPIWASLQVDHSPNTGNINTLYNNVSSNGFVNNISTGIFAVDPTKLAIDGHRVAHTGWVLRTVGTGGRAGRVMTEVLVAGHITTDAGVSVYKSFNGNGNVRFINEINSGLIGAIGF